MSDIKHKVTNLSLVTVPNVTKTRFTEKAVSGKKWLAYGADNKFPDYLWKLYCDAPTQAAIIDAKTSWTMGSSMKGGDEIANKAGETIEEVMRKAVFDLHLFGGMAIQVIYNVKGEIAEVYWADFSKIRTNQAAKVLYWADDWGSWSVEPKEYPAFNPEAESKRSQIFYYRGAVCRSVYPAPCYLSAIDSMQTECEIQHFHLNNIKNGFAANTIINCNGGVPEEKERKEFEKMLNKKFSGADNAGKLLISWNETKDNAITVERMEDNTFDQKFTQLRRDTMENIIVAHRLTSGTLLGRTPTNTGFTRNEFAEAFKIFNVTVIQPYQKQVLQVLKKIFPDKEFEFEPFDIPIAEKGAIPENLSV